MPISSRSSSSRASTSGLLLACALAGCGGEPPDASGPDTTADAGTSSAPLSLSRVAADAVSPYALRLTAEASRASTRTLRLTPADAGPFTLTGGQSSVVASGLKPATRYRLQVEAEDAGEHASGSADGQTQPARTFRVLFDDKHGEANVGSADWVIDDQDGPPQPAQISDEKQWKGALSSWALGLVRSGRYKVETTSGPLTYGESRGQDLSKVDVLVLPEPNNWGDLGKKRDPALGAAERDAIVKFVKAGGGLVAIADHSGSDRDIDGVDSIRVLQPLLQALASGIQFNVGSKEYGSTGLFAPGEQVAQGPFGKVGSIALYAGTTLRVDAGGAAHPIAFRVGADPANPTSPNFLYSAGAEIGQGRVFVHGDSSSAGDGTGRVNDPDHAAWGDRNYSHASYFLNATAWTAHEY